MARCAVGLVLGTVGSWGAVVQVTEVRSELDETKDMDDMNDGRAGLRGRADRPRRWRAGALAAALAVTALLAAACGGSSPDTNSFAPGATYGQMLAFAKCMRSNGVPQFPDPDRQGIFNNATIQALDSNASQDRTALFQCRSVLPNAGTGLTVEQIQQIQQQNVRDAVKGARCMRAHGITNFPDPSATTGASGVNWWPVISAMQAGEFSTGTPSYEAAIKICNNKRNGGGIIPALQEQILSGSGPPSGSPSPVSSNGS